MTRKLNKRKLSFNTIIYILVAICTLISFFPTLFSFVIAFVTEKNGQIMFEDPSAFFNGLTFENFMKVLSESNIPRWTLNSFVVAISQTILYVLIASLAAYGF